MSIAARRWANPDGDTPTPRTARFASGGLARLGGDTANVLAVVLLVAAITFNALLAIVNGHLMSLNGGIVALAQAAITFAALGTALLRRPEGLARWLIYLWFAITLWVLLTIVRGTLDPKIAGDILLVPAFAALGLTIRRNALFATLAGLQAALIAFAIFELFFPTAFGELFKVRDYYVSTRGFASDVFWAGEDNLFLSSQRPGGRILTLGLEINRGASLFLEPVTLGNWTIVVSVALAAFWNDLRLRMRAFFIATNVLLLIACDGRLAMAVNALILVSLPVFTRLPPWRQWLPPFYLPVVFLLLLSAWGTGFVDAEASYDNLQGRYANSINFVMKSDLLTLLGARHVSGLLAADSGWLHIIISQSIFGLAAYWLALSLMGGSGPRGQRFAHSAAVFFALALPVSYSVLSIKSAAALWMILGAAWVADRSAAKAAR